MTREEAAAWQLAESPEHPTQERHGRRDVIDAHTLGSYTHPMLTGYRAANARSIRASNAGVRAVNRRARLHLSPYPLAGPADGPFQPEGFAPTS